MRALRIWIRNKYIGITNLIQWLPIIWQDRDWDHAYLEELMLFKLTRMYKRFSNPEETYVDWDGEHAKDLKALRICITILERRKNNFYYEIQDYYRYLFLDTESTIEYRDWKLFNKLMTEHCPAWWD